MKVYSCGLSYIDFSIRTLDGLMYRLFDDWQNLVVRLSAARKAVHGLDDQQMSEDIVAGVVSCCLRPDPRSVVPVPKCRYCEAERLLIAYEQALFDYDGE